MDRERILQKLKEDYGLKNKHVLILRTVAQHTDIPADKLSRVTDIPLGRLYTYLNELCAMKLVYRTPRKPYRYYIEDFNHAVIDFMRHRMNKFIKAEGEVLELMKGDAPENIELIKSKEDYTHAHIKLISESKNIRLSCFHRSFPFILYPEKFEEFLDLRRAIADFRPTISFVDADALYIIFQTYRRAIEEQKKFDIIVEKWTLLDHISLIKDTFGESWFNKYVEQITALINQGNIKVRAIEEYVPMQIDIGDNILVLALTHLNMSTGIVLRSPVVRELYSTLFEQKLPRTKEFLEYLRVQ
ncbi:hypothetical protein GF342_02480 [Candidatus Woesearchaeota archaeon]|nr:hypothetical protein [Candidatus Woesearchaeota archaeon]